MKNSILIVYHANCIDGFTSAWVAFNALNTVEASICILPADYSKASEQEILVLLEKYECEDVYIVDYSLPVEFILSCLYTHPYLESITILDHHESAFKKYLGDDYDIDAHPVVSIHLAQKCSVYLDNTKCGAVLTWEYFNTDIPMPTLLTYVQDWDLHTMVRGLETCYVHEYLLSKPQHFHTWNDTAYLLDKHGQRESILTVGKALYTIKMKDIFPYVERAIPVQFKGYKGYFVSCPYTLATSIGDAILVRPNAQLFICCTSIEEVKLGEEMTWSMRSRKDVNVATIAESYGGGGHKGAAGFRLSYDESRALMHSFYEGDSVE